MAASDTVQGQLNGILSSNSPLMKRAETFGKQQANRRGLLNSSMAAGASQGAMIEAALPIAQQDASQQFQKGQMAQQQKNTLEQMARGNQYDVGLANLQQKNTLEQMKRDRDYSLDQLQASSTANAWGMMANNITDIVAQGMEGIANIQANPDISSSDKTKMINQITKMRDSDINFQKGLYQNLQGYLRNTGLFPNL